MNESLTDFVTELSGSDISVLEDIIANKFTQFQKFFDLLRSHTKDIKKFKYEIDEPCVLSVTVTFKKKVDLNDKKELIKQWKSAGYDVTHSIKDTTMKVQIKHTE